MRYDIRGLTRQYVSAFDARDLDRVRDLMDPEFILTDPGNINLTPREDVLNLIGSIFADAGDTLSFRAKTVLVDGYHSVIEFELTIGADRFEGIDLIEWQNGLMISMRAHLTKRGAFNGS